MTDDMPELTKADFAKAIRHGTRKRLMSGKFRGGSDVAALRRFVDMSQTEFARALGISVHTLRNWEQDRRAPHGPALALLRVAARHPRVLRENLATAS
jgi:putative transcriptional regulator